MTAGSENAAAVYAEDYPADQSNQEFKSSKKSGPPSRFLSYRCGSWFDFPREVFDVLAGGFIAGKTALEVPIGGSSFLFDFVRMVQVDPASGASSPIAWIDVNGRCFFPQAIGHEHRYLQYSNRSASSSAVSTKNSLGFTQELSDESPGISTKLTVSLSQPRWPGTEALKEDDKCYKVVAKLFLARMTRFNANTTITSIHKCLYSVPPRNSRLKTFQMQMEATRAARGRENVKFGWFATATSKLAAIISHGFGQTNNMLLGSGAHGVGVHLSPPHSPYSSAVLLELDGNGERHILLCRAIMGRTEKVKAGSLQYHPTSEEFDNGVDDLANPKWYIVWSTHMNTHIIPEYVVSYKFPKHCQGARKLMMNSTTSPSSGMSFYKLFAEITRSLPSSMTRALEISYLQFRECKISKEDFIRCLRSIAGDKLLTSSIKKIRGY
ncbi:putative inactive poly [Canna indica]|uniref:Inactive poly n=1 Tax=Canna indica TaxID=4628 RepID=A0AAQ3JSV7_9LILI|nr:putative inactive poly [Canna indica]